VTQPTTAPIVTARRSAHDFAHVYTTMFVDPASEIGVHASKIPFKGVWTATVVVDASEITLHCKSRATLVRLFRELADAVERTEIGS
jgi:hypothetical protein